MPVGFFFPNYYLFLIPILFVPEFFSESLPNSLKNVEITVSKTEYIAVPGAAALCLNDN